MKDRYRLVRRGGVFYAHDRQTQLRTSLKTKDRARAKRLHNHSARHLPNSSTYRLAALEKGPALQFASFATCRDDEF